MIADLKAKIAAEEGIPIQQKVLNFQGRRLEDSETLADYGIRSDNVVFMF